VQWSPSLSVALLAQAYNIVSFLRDKNYHSGMDNNMIVFTVDSVIINVHN